MSIVYSLQQGAFDIKRDILEGTFRTFFSRRMLAIQFQVTDAIKSVKASVEYTINFNSTCPKKYSLPIAQPILYLRLFVMISLVLNRSHRLRSSIFGNCSFNFELFTE